MIITSTDDSPRIYEYLLLLSNKIYCEIFGLFITDRLSSWWSSIPMIGMDMLSLIFGTYGDKLINIIVDDLIAPILKNTLLSTDSVSNRTIRTFILGDETNGLSINMFRTYITNLIDETNEVSTTTSTTETIDTKIKKQINEPLKNILTSYTRFFALSIATPLSTYFTIFQK